MNEKGKKKYGSQYTQVYNFTLKDGRNYKMDKKKNKKTNTQKKKENKQNKN